MVEHFFIVGAQRSGTSYLYQILDEHPEIEMAKPVKPEPKFFHLDNLYQNGLEYYINFYFQKDSGACIRGEKSTSYMESEKAARRISHAFPDAKILFLLRDPIERAISNYWFSVENGFEKLSIQKAFLQEESRQCDYDPNLVSVSPYAYLRRGRYIEYISIYERYFPFENLKVLVHENLIGNLKDIRALYQFLDVRSDFTPPSLNKKVNESHKADINTPELEDYLLRYFASANEKLQYRFGLDIKSWKHLAE